MASPGWFNENEHRAYPFVVGTVGLDADGPLTLRNLPPGLVLDACFTAGPSSGFVPGTHSVYLSQVRRVGTAVTLSFASNAPGLLGVPLDFTLSTLDDFYAYTFADSDPPPSSDSSESRDADCSGPAWYGVVAVRGSSFQTLLAGDGVVPRGAGGAVVEPGRIRSLAGTVITGVGLANDDRTRAVSPDDCDQTTFPYRTGVVFTSAGCLAGDVAFRAGYNCYVRQNSFDNSVTLGAAVGYGEGEPCDEVPLFPGESAPDGSTLLSGGLRCNETLRAVNGVGGPDFLISAGPGVSVTADPENHKVVVAVTLAGLDFQLPGSERSESV